jgi:hypothetical protein
MSLHNQLAEYISACFTGLWLQSHEHEDALAEIAQLCEPWTGCGSPRRSHAERTATGSLTSDLISTTCDKV